MCIDEIFAAIKSERAAQENKWGEQNHPMLPVLTYSPIALSSSSVALKVCAELGIPTEDRAKELTDLRAQQGELSYFHILQEEVSEAVCALDDYESMRKELIQVAAVTVAMIQALDRNGR